MDSQAQIKDILQSAITMHASDIVCTVGEHPVYKIYGKWATQESYPVFTEQSMWELLGFLSSPHDESFIAHMKKEKDVDFGAEVEGVGRFRANAFFTIKGPSCVLRVVNTHIPTFAELSLPEEQFQSFADLPHGLVLFTGSMGSGKSTSMASLVEYINEHHNKHIVTIEDPIEYIYNNKQSVIEQREVGMHTATFQRGLKSSLRVAANVILLGELRDLETIELAITAAETGTLVLASLHTAGVEHAIDRIVDAFSPSKQEQVRVQLSQILRAVVWQMLLPSTDGKVVPATEVLINNSAVANLIRKGQTHQIPNIVSTSAASGMMTMAQSIHQLVYEEKVEEEAAMRILKQVKGGE